MSKRTFIWFGVLILVLAVVIPFAAFRAKGDGESGETEVPANLKGAQSLFVVNCGTCHTLASAGTDGNYAPNLDQILSLSPTAAEGSTEEVQKANETNWNSNYGRVPSAVTCGL